MVRYMADRAECEVKLLEDVSHRLDAEVVSTPIIEPKSSCRCQIDPPGKDHRRGFEDPGYIPRKDPGSPAKPRSPSVTVTSYRLEGLEPASLTDSVHRMKIARTQLTAAKLELHDAEVELKKLEAEYRNRGLEGSNEKQREADLRLKLGPQVARVADAKRALVLVRCDFANAVADVRLVESLIELAKAVR